jgi:hypothetical protein
MIDDRINTILFNNLIAACRLWEAYSKEIKPLVEQSKQDHELHMAINMCTAIWEKVMEYDNRFSYVQGLVAHLSEQYNRAHQVDEVGDDHASEPLLDVTSASRKMNLIDAVDAQLESLVLDLEDVLNDIESQLAQATSMIPPILANLDRRTDQQQPKIDKIQTAVSELSDEFSKMLRPRDIANATNRVRIHRLRITSGCNIAPLPRHFLPRTDLAHTACQAHCTQGQRDGHIPAGMDDQCSQQS